MAFNVQADPSNTANITQTASVDITLSPATAVINATNMKPGDSVTGVINVSNTGTVDVYYFVSADWKAGGTTQPSMATLLANKLTVSVDAGSPATSLYTGTLAGLINQPASPGRQLTLATGNENVSITVTLPSNAGSIYQNIQVSTDFVFVAQA